MIPDISMPSGPLVTQSMAIENACEGTTASELADNQPMANLLVFNWATAIEQYLSTYSVFA